jgi:hypothetical protein
VQDQLVAQRRLGLAPPWLVMPRGVDGVRAGLLAQLAEHAYRIAASQDQPAVLGFQALGQCSETVMQPPPLRPADPPFARRIVVQNVDRNDRPRMGSGGEGGLVVQAQVLPQP